jgi:hypothetical protein
MKDTHVHDTFVVMAPPFTLPSAKSLAPATPREERLQDERPWGWVSVNPHSSQPPLTSLQPSFLYVHRVHIWVEMKYRECICPLSWSVHCTPEIGHCHSVCTLWCLPSQSSQCALCTVQCASLSPERRHGPTRVMVGPDTRDISYENWKHLLNQ